MKKLARVILDRWAERALPGASEPRPWSLAARFNVLLPGLYAWATTVAVPVASARAPTSARVLAMAALLALVLGPLIASTRPLLGRVLGIHGFVGLALLSWGFGARAGLTLGAEPLQATCGALGWMMFALGWGDPHGRSRTPTGTEPDAPSGAELRPRGELDRSVNYVFACGVIGALLLVFMAARVSRPVHGVMAQACALVAGLSLIGGAARIALARGPRALPSRSERLAASRAPLAALAILLGLGLLVRVLGR